MDRAKNHNSSVSLKIAQLFENAANGDFSKTVNFTQSEREDNGSDIDLAIVSYEKMRSFTDQINGISSGDYSAEMTQHSDQDKLGSALQRLTVNLRNVSKVAETVGNGNFSRKVKEQGTEDVLAKSMNKMIFQLQQTKIKTVMATQEVEKSKRELVFQKHALDEHAIVSIVDRKGTITYVNDKFCAISGYNRAELIGQNHSLLESGEHPDEFFRDMLKTIANGNTWNGEINNKNKSGGYFWLQTTIVPTTDEAGIPFQYVRIQTDITDEKLKTGILLLATDEAKSATLAKSQFLASMSHEIRTPMAGVIGMADLILDTDLSPRQLDWATSIKTSGENLLTILNEILDQSKLESGKLDIAPVDFHLVSFIENTTQLFGPKIDDKGLTLDVEMNDALPDGVYADSMRMGQILSNLLSNALKFTASGSITVRVTHTQNDDGSFMLRISVTDSGIGVNNEVQAKLFTAFTQADSSTSRNYGGTGLGLSISKQLTELMGGKIGVDSAEGMGSTFWFTTHCHPVSGEIEAPDKRRSLDRWISSRSLNVLVAEDNLVNQQLIQAIFEKLNHQVTVVDNGKLATECVEDGDFDLVLMDIRMPVMDGLQATTIIRSRDDEKSNIPIIALTADIAAGNIKQFTDIGVNDVCSKPLDLPVLLKAINKLVGEEIHTSLSYARPANKDRDRENTDSDEAPTGFTIFSQVLERVACIVDQVTEIDEEEPHENLASLGAERFAELVQMYTDSLSEQCDELKSELDVLSRNLIDEEQRSKLKFLTHTLKGGGGSFGYNLVTIIATQADILLKENEVLDDTGLQTLMGCSEALSLVARKKMSGNGGKAGRILLQGLKEFS